MDNIIEEKRVTKYICITRLRCNISTSAPPNYACKCYIVESMYVIYTTYIVGRGGHLWNYVKTEILGWCFISEGPSSHSCPPECERKHTNPNLLAVYIYTSTQPHPASCRSAKLSMACDDRKCYTLPTLPDFIVDEKSVAEATRKLSLVDLRLLFLPCSSCYLIWCCFLQIVLLHFHFTTTSMRTLPLSLSNM